MTALFLSKPSSKLLVIGPLYDRLNEDSLHIEKLIDEYDWILINGGLCHPSDSLGSIQTRLLKIKQLTNTDKVIYIAGRNDLLYFNQLDNEITHWIQQCCNIVVIKYASRTVLVTDGGISPEIKSLNDVAENIEPSFVSYINNKPWHLTYNGGLGYVISNSPHSDKSQYYSYSMQLGTNYSQEFDEIGLKRTILL